MNDKEIREIRDKRAERLKEIKDQGAKGKEPPKTQRPLLKKFAADKATLDRIRRLLGVPDEANCNRILIDLTVDGLVRVFTSGLVSDPILDKVVKSFVKSQPGAKDDRSKSAHDTTTFANKKFKTFQPRERKPRGIE